MSVTVKCPHCGETVHVSTLLGSSTQADASRENGKKGGRPPKTQLVERLEIYFAGIERGIVWTPKTFAEELTQSGFHSYSVRQAARILKCLVEHADV